MFSTDWVTHNQVSWMDWLKKFKGQPNIRMLEIGSFEGRSAVWMLENILTDPSSTIDCIDLFEISEEYGNYHQRFRSNTAQWEGQITEHMGSSFTMLPRVTGKFDIIYIDGWHTAYGALADAVMSWPILKKNGVMIFDDYLWMPPGAPKIERPSRLIRRFYRLIGRGWRYEMTVKAINKRSTETPKLGIDAFLSTLEGSYEVIGENYQLAVRKVDEAGDFDFP